RNFALEADEVDAGYVLACQSHPVTEKVELDFVLGGNSMLAFRVQRRIQRETGTTVDFADILTCSVLRDLAHHLDRSPEPRMVP
ncbi:acyl carrier protein, partial [Streptomyces decoyicus]|uniref:acyl carrier protein n=1 Tax=Streptomyces decoyicus TaxID=249567 RepID=UPI00339E7840